MHPNPNSLLPLHSSSTSSHSSSSSSFSFSKVTAGVESATNHLSTLPPKGTTTGAFNVNNMPSSGGGAMLNRKDVADEADEEDFQDFFMKERSTTRKKKRVPEAPAPPNTLVQNSVLLPVENSRSVLLPLQKKKSVFLHVQRFSVNSGSAKKARNFDVAMLWLHVLVGAHPWWILIVSVLAPMGLLLFLIRLPCQKMS